MLRNPRAGATALSLAALGAALAVPATAPAAAADPVEAGITVPVVENLSSDFMNGVDVSSILSLEESGVTFTGFDGEEADLFDVMAEAGVNYVRVRVWNDPFNSTTGDGYGGGNVDAARATEIGQRATAAGMKVFVDFHYSDFWAHPGQQTAPKAWDGLSAADKATALYDYTVDTLQLMDDSGVDVGMVQIGNETTGLELAGEDWPASAPLFQAGSAAVTDALGEDVKVAIHFTNPERGNWLGYADQLADAGIDYDVFAGSYYAYWHGTTENLTAQLASVADTYGKEVVVAETSWNHTLEDGDGHENTIRPATESDKYSSSVQGQALAVRDVIAAVADVGDAGLGVFYWEPAWLPVGTPDQLEQNQELWEAYGSGWAASAAGEYSADAAAYYGGSSWDNQALFDFTGAPLESLRVFDYVRYGTVAPREVDQVSSPSLTVTDGETITLPAAVSVSYTDGTSEQQAVTWAASPDWIVGPGTYAFAGTTSEGLDATATVEVLSADVDATNYVVNPGFEDGADPWTGTMNISVGDDPHDGSSRSAHFYTATGGTRTVIQEITGVPAGDYRLSAYAQGRAKVEGESTYITVSSGIATVNREFSLAGWTVWQNPVTDVITVGADGQVTVSATFTTTDGAWGTIDDFALVADVPADVADTAALAALLGEAATIDPDGYTAVSYLALTRAIARAEFVLGSPSPSQATADAALASLQAAIDGLVEGDPTPPAPTVRAVEVTVVAGDAIALPDTVTVVAYDGATSTEAVTWRSSVDWISGPGVYTVTGLTEGGWTATATITVTPGGLVNSGFAAGDGTGWVFDTTTGVDAFGVFDNVWSAAEADDTFAVNAWHGEGDYDFTLSQAVEGLSPGTYELTAGGHGSDEGDAGLTAELFAGDAVAPFTFAGWGAWDHPTVTVEVDASGELTVGVRGAGGSGDYVWLDEFSLERVDAATADTSALEAAIAAAGAVDRGLYTAASLEALDVAVESGHVVLAADRPEQEDVDAATALVEDAIAALVVRPCTVAYEAGSGPKGTFTGKLRITNASDEAFAGWQLGWSFAGDEVLTKVRPADFLQEGADVVVLDGGARTVLKPGDTLTLRIKGEGEPLPVAEFTLNGMACAVD